MLNCSPLGIIKGSEESLGFQNRMLTREAFEEHKNVHVDYSIFEAYRKCKRERGERDHADRCVILQVVQPTYDLFLHFSGFTHSLMLRRNTD